MNFNQSGGSCETEWMKKEDMARAAYGAALLHDIK
jgi:hypothetical protein